LTLIENTLFLALGKRISGGCRNWCPRRWWGEYNL